MVSRVCVANGDTSLSKAITTQAGRRVIPTRLPLLSLVGALECRQHALDTFAQIVPVSMGREALKLSVGERLIISLLADVHEHLGIENSVSPQLLRAAVLDGHIWALDWTYQSLADDYSVDKNVVKHVVDTLDMYMFLETGFEALHPDEQERVKAANYDSSPTFRGWDGNNESQYNSVASTLIDDMKRFGHFESRSHLNSHMPSVDVYDRMLAAFIPIRETLSFSNLSADQIVAVLAERVHPANRK